jgi:hypothetical protein
LPGHKAHQMHFNGRCNLFSFHLFPREYMAYLPASSYVTELNNCVMHMSHDTGLMTLPSSARALHPHPSGLYPSCHR